MKFDPARSEDHFQCHRSQDRLRRKSGSWCLVEHAKQNRYNAWKAGGALRGSDTFPDAVAQVRNWPASSQLDIECVADRAGVGRNLQNHQYLHYAITIPRARALPSFRHYFVAGIRFFLSLSQLSAERPVDPGVGPGQLASIWVRPRDARPRCLYALLARGRQAQKRGSSRDAQNRLQHV